METVVLSRPFSRRGLGTASGREQGFRDANDRSPADLYESYGDDALAGDELDPAINRF
jgi:hypothetical protein